MPANIRTGVHNGYAFVNFTTPASAAVLRHSWHRGHPSWPDLDVKPAVTQGFAQNVSKWNAPNARTARVRNPQLRPWVLGDKSVGTPVRRKKTGQAANALESAHPTGVRPSLLAPTVVVDEGTESAVSPTLVVELTDNNP